MAGSITRSTDVDGGGMPLPGAPGEFDIVVSRSPGRGRHSELPGPRRSLRSVGSYQLGSTQRDRAGDLPRSAAAGGCIAALEPSGLTTALEVGWPGSGSPRRAPLERRSGSLALAALRPCYRLCRRTVPSTKSVGATDSVVQREDQQGTQTRPSRRLIALVAASCAVAVEAARATAALRPSERAARQSLSQVRGQRPAYRARGTCRVTGT